MKIRAMLLAVWLCTPAIVSAQGSTASIDGTWDIVMNGFGGKITFSGGASVLTMISAGEDQRPPFRRVSDPIHPGVVVRPNGRSGIHGDRLRQHDAGNAHPG
jgi:hypothetical protein